MSSPTTATHAGRERPLAQGTSRHPSVKQSINCMEACNQQSTCQTLQPDQDWVCRFGCASFLMEWEGAPCPFLHSLRPAVIQAKGLSLTIMSRKRSQVGSMLRCDCW